MDNIIDLIISFGALQGFIIGAVLLAKGLRSKREEIYLSFILIGLAAILGRVLVISFYQEQSSLFIYLNFIFLISPALYLFARASLKTDKIIKVKYSHFLPFIVFNTAFIVLYFVFKNTANYQSYLQNSLRLGEGISILYFAFYLYRTHKFCTENQASFVKVRYQLLKVLKFVFFMYFMIWLIYVLAEWLYFKYTMNLKYYYPIMLVLATTLYYLSLQVLIHVRLFADIKGAFGRKTVLADELEGNQLLDKLTFIMKQEKPYLDEDVSLAVLAESLDASPKTLSYVINQYANKNYNDYINAWRVDEVKARLNDPKYDRYKMLSIAFDCGFKSKSTFNLAFKKATGMSPSEYKNSLKS